MFRGIRIAEHILLAGLGIAFVVSLTLHLQSGTVDIPAVPATRTLVTAAHLGSIEGYECIFSDEEADYAVYVKQNYTAFGLAEGDRVSLAGTMATVSSVSPAEFAVEVDDISKIAPGVSGQSVYLDGRPVGFISGWNGAGALRCIFY